MKLSPYNVAFCGPAGGGKTTMAVALNAALNGKVLSFATHLKEEVAAAKGITVKELNRNKAELRSELQEYGSLKREEDASYWIKHLDADMARAYGYGVRTFLVDDLRLPNEYEHLKALGFMIVRVHENPHYHPHNEVSALHPAENYWQDFDVDLELPWIEPAIRNQRYMLESLVNRYRVLYDYVIERQA